MANPVHPFAKAPGKASYAFPVATPGFVDRRLREELGKLHFTAQGCKVASNAEGNIDLNVTGLGNEGLLWSWQVQAVEGGVNITPGLVLVQTAEIAPFVPVYQSVSLDDDDAAPVIPVPATGTCYGMMVIEFDKNGAPKNTPWEIKIYTTLPDPVPLIRPLNGNPGQDCKLYAPIFKMVDSSVVVQTWLARPITVACYYNNVLYL